MKKITLVLFNNKDFIAPGQIAYNTKKKKISEMQNAAHFFIYLLIYFIYRFIMIPFQMYAYMHKYFCNEIRCLESLQKHPKITIKDLTIDSSKQHLAWTVNIH